MRVSTASLALLSVAAPAAVQAATGTLGFALGTKKADGTCKFQADYEDDFDLISQHSSASIVRGYSASDCNAAAEIMPAAAAKNFQVVLGIWPDVQESFEADTSAITAVADEYQDNIYAVTVGSETLYRGNFTGEELLDKINTVKDQLPSSIKVGTADSWNKFDDGTADAVIRGGVDILFVNAFAYWQGQDIDNATATYFEDMQRAFGHIQDVSGSLDSPELWNGETGWPTTGGSDFGPAEASTENAQQYWQQGVCGMLEWGVSLFYFEAFDEPWKPDSIGDNGEAADEKHWGAMTVDGDLKFSLEC
ncbi:putative glucan 1,3-beta-glucosidase [Lineolata rhizophorae]|uniref:glucan 1,3-beta-glucosidase n=1 Tax=Lineolata rhizophorae TaxID=578093 RepID=A0A6A6PB97_9PEZI|nr:putative glucan 1,3-beta-glucosidase [Lineolata rhizophorae]